MEAEKRIFTQQLRELTGVISEAKRGRCGLGDEEGGRGVTTLYNLSIKSELPSIMVPADQGQGLQALTHKRPLYLVEIRRNRLVKGMQGNKESVLKEVCTEVEA